MSGGTLFSSHWHRVRELKPMLAKDVRVVQHLYRGRSSHLLLRPSNDAQHRIDSLAYDLIARLDGRTTVGDAWESAQEKLGDEAPTQPDFLRLLSTLHEADLIVVDRALDAERLFRRGNDATERRWKERLANPLYLRFRLGDPTRLLTVLAPMVRGLFSRAALVAWCMLVVVALACVLPALPRLVSEIGGLGDVGARHVLIFAFIYVVMKALHELAHALTVRHLGGEVREFGIALMVLLPNPYTDASAASWLTSKHQRMAVSVAGIVVELGLAAIAAVVWSLSNGLVHDLALLVMLTGGLSTVLFNGNPLLKFDGYFVLADWLEIPNLAVRARRHMLRQARRLVVGSDSSPALAADRTEAWILGTYGSLALLYRIALVSSIAWMLSGRYFFFGVLLAAFALYGLLIVPAWRLIGFLAAQAPGVRRRGFAVTMVLPTIVVILVVAVPLPYATVADGVVWLPEQAIVRAAHRCDVTEQYVQEGARVEVGDPLLFCADAELFMERAVLRAQVSELKAARAGLATVDPLQYQLRGQDLSDAEATLSLVDERWEAQQIRSAVSGRFVAAGRTELIGRHVAQGDLVAYVIPPDERTIRVALTQREIGQLAMPPVSISVALLEQSASMPDLQTSIVRQTPRPSRHLLSKAFVSEGGGRLVSSGDSDDLMLAAPAFDIELSWPAGAPVGRVGGAVRVRFKHEAEPLVGRMATGARRAFAGHFTS